MYVTQLTESSLEFIRRSPNFLFNKLSRKSGEGAEEGERRRRTNNSDLVKFSHVVFVFSCLYYWRRMLMVPCLTSTVRCCYIGYIFICSLPLPVCLTCLTSNVKFVDPLFTEGAMSIDVFKKIYRGLFFYSGSYTDFSPVLCWLTLFIIQLFTYNIHKIVSV